MAKAEDMLRLARSEIGYTEEPTNITKYWTALTNANWFDGMNKQGGEWCMGFQCWLALMVTGSKAEGRKLLCQTGPLGACCDDQVIYFKNAGRFFDTPQLGDLVFFDYDPEKNNGEDHVGIVDEILSYGFYSIEGNSRDSVRRNFYYFTDKDIAGFGRPLYDGTSAVAPEQKKEEPKPVKPSNGVTYTVKSGDTLYDIAEDFGNVSWQELAKINGIEPPYIIYPGDVLQLSGAKPTVESSTKLEVGSRVYMDSEATVYGREDRFDSFVYHSILYVRQIDDDSVLVSTQREGAYTGWVNKKYLKLA